MQGILHNPPRTDFCSVRNIKQVRETLQVQEKGEGFKSGTNLSMYKARAVQSCTAAMSTTDSVRRVYSMKSNSLYSQDRELKSLMLLSCFRCWYKSLIKRLYFQ